MNQPKIKVDRCVICMVITDLYLLNPTKFATGLESGFTQIIVCPVKNCVVRLFENPMWKPALNLS